MDDVVKNLENLRERLQDAAHDVFKKIEQVRDIPKVQSLVGKCFKHIEYSSAGNFCMYIKVRSAIKLILYVECFYITSVNNTFCFEKNHAKGLYTFENNPGYIPISTKEYSKELRKFLKKLQKQIES